MSNVDAYKHPEYLVETDWLEQHLDDPDLRLFDCTVIVKQNPVTETKKQRPFVYQSGIHNFDKIHIPNAGFIDVPNDLSDNASIYPLMMPAHKQFIDMMNSYGITNEVRVVLYSTTESNWATRVWWMMRSYGFKNVSVLNGGWNKWKSERRAVTDETCTYKPSKIAAEHQDNYFCNKVDVLSAITDDHTRIINALPPGLYDGSSDVYFGRKGRISESVNVPFTSLHDMETGCYLPAEQLQRLYNAVDVNNAEKIIAYCGGGIAASNTAFTLSLLGYENISIYDGSMLEWGNYSSLPMDVG